jgi:hypothetical protein
MDGSKDVADLFTRVSALEQEDADSDQTVTRIAKLYDTLGFRVRLKYNLHDYRFCGDTNPIFGAVTSTTTFI